MPFRPEDDDRREAWENAGPIEARMVSLDGACRHELGTTFVYEHPYDTPAELCHAATRAFEPYLWRVASGFPSWEADDSSVYRIHCPSKKGTVWELRKVGDATHD